MYTKKAPIVKLFVFRPTKMYTSIYTFSMYIRIKYNNIKYGRRVRSIWQSPRSFLCYFESFNIVAARNIIPTNSTFSFWLNRYTRFSTLLSFNFYLFHLFHFFFLPSSPYTFLSPAALVYSASARLREADRRHERVYKTLCGGTRRGKRGGGKKNQTYFSFSCNILYGNIV